MSNNRYVQVNQPNGRTNLGKRNNNNKINERVSEVVYNIPRQYSPSYQISGAMLGRENTRNNNMRNDFVYAAYDVLLFSLIHVLVLFLEKKFNPPYKFNDESYQSRFVKALIWNLAFMYLIVLVIAGSQQTMRGYRMYVFLGLNIVKFILFKFLIEPVDVGL